MLLKLAWRNIWRNKRRSIIVITSVAVGVVATMVYDTLSRGMVFQMLNNQIGAHVSHIQIHRKGFKDNPEAQSYIPDDQAVEKVVRETPGVAHFSERVLTYGLVSSAANSSGVSIIGVDPAQEQFITMIKKNMVAGEYLSGRPNEVVLGKSLAEKLDVGLGERVVAMASAIDGHVGSDVFKVVGTFQTPSSEFDKSSIYIIRPNAQQMLGLGTHVSEFALILNDVNQLDQIREIISRKLGDTYEVLTYPEILPLLVLMINITEQSMVIFYVIVGIALIFGIINTMLMSVFERVHEFGVLKAIGMKDGKMLSMVLFEAFFLGMVGTVIGFGIGYVIYVSLSGSGLNLAVFSEGLRSFGVGAIIYPVLTWDVIADALLVIPFVAVVGAIYPGMRAVRLHPIDAIRYV